jgi:hypothetical protein
MQSIKRAFRRKLEKGWPKLYIAIDLHEVIITPTYNRYNEGAELYFGAKEVLQNWTGRDDICLILWTGSHQDAIDNICERLGKEGIRFNYFNENPEVPSSEICDFSRKFYFDVVMDDKGFFEAETDWLRVKQAMQELGEWK